MTNPLPQSSSRWPLYLIILLLVVVLIVFGIELKTSIEAGAAPEATPEVGTNTYEDVVAALLQNANPDNGAQLVGQYGCVACHRAGVANHVAPAFVDIAARAATRRPPLTAAAYIYESITNPLAYIVSGFNPIMPQDFRQRLSDRELGDIIAYLLTPDAK